MSLFNILDNEELLNKFKIIIFSKRISNAYLLHGKDISNIEAIALEFAGMLLCENNESTPCGLCESCTRVKYLEHPDLDFVYPLPKREESPGDDPFKGVSNRIFDEIESILREKAVDPYKKFQVTNARSIPISFIRMIRKRAYLKPQESSRRVVIVFDAHNLTEQGSNAFLKILEEPPSDTTFLILSDHPEMILPTIKSRCQHVYIPSINHEALISKLRDMGIEEAMANILARFSEYNITQVYELINYNITDLVNYSINLLISVAKWDKVEIKERINELVDYYKRDRKKFFLIMKCIQFWFRDATLLSRGIMEDIILADKIDRLEKFVKNYPFFNGEGLYKAVDNCIDLLKSNVYINVALMNMMFEIKEKLGRKGK